MNYKEIAKKNFLLKEQNLSINATKSIDAIRMEEEPDDIRPSFYHDIDRIIHAMSYTRYSDKTQVFSFQDNDHITKRMVHVQLVSKIARTIGRALNLNEDLIEAIALGHDIGHTPLGHTGEFILNEISKKELNESFAHNIHGVRHYMYIEKNGKGLNLSIQVLDGIMCHNGEILSNTYIPEKKTKETFIQQYEMAYKNLKETNSHKPMTLEGCVVRISDIIGYIGRDIEDAIILGKIKREEIPTDIKNVLGTTNKDIVNNIILDIIKNSIDKPYIKMSKEVYSALFKLKEFNYENIYKKSMTPEEIEYYKEGMNKLFYKYLQDIKEKNYKSIIFEIYLNYMTKEYIENTNDKRKVIDFIAGMTDALFVNEIKRCKNQKIMV